MLSERFLFCETKMSESHAALILCGVSVMLFLVALRPWLPFYAAGTNMAVLKVRVTLDGNPVGNTKVSIYDLIPECFQSPPIPNIDPATLDSPIKEGYTDSSGEVEFTLNHGNYTVRIENKAILETFAIEAVFLNKPEQEVDFTFATVHLEPVPVAHRALSLSYINTLMLCLASALMATGTVTFMHSRKK